MHAVVFEQWAEQAIAKGAPHPVGYGGEQHDMRGQLVLADYGDLLRAHSGHRAGVACLVQGASQAGGAGRSPAHTDPKWTVTQRRGEGDRGGDRVAYLLRTRLDDGE